MTRLRDLVIVGGGYRTVSFLAQSPELWGLDIEIIERCDRFGAGAFADYDCVSSSVSNRFLRGVPPELMAGVGSAIGIEELTRHDAVPRPLSEISSVMASMGEVLSARAHLDVRTQTHVDEIKVSDDAVAVVTDGGGISTARHVVLATGREERPHPELDQLRARTVLSSEFISLRRASEMRQAILAAKSSVVVVGASHSAAAALVKLVALREECGRPDLEIVVVRRGGVRLHYLNLHNAIAERTSAHEAVIDPLADICPETLQVNRDSGLRGHGQHLFRQLMDGELPHARLEAYPNLAAASNEFVGASLIIQALGYRGRAPRITLADGQSRDPKSESHLTNLTDGTAVVCGLPQRLLSVLRVEPTPTVLRDHGLYGQTLYAKLRHRLMGDLGVAS